MKKGRDQLGTIGLVLVFILASVTVFFPLVERTKDPVNQKMLFVANDLSLLVRVLSYLPENSNIVYSEFLDGTASMSQNTLYVTTSYELPANVKQKSSVNLQSEKVPISFMYVVKTDDLITFSTSSASNCGFVDVGPIREAEITSKSKTPGDRSESLAVTLQQLMQGTNSIEAGNDFIISFVTSDNNRILFNDASNKNTLALACNIQRSTGFERKTVSESGINEIIIEITPEVDDIVTAKLILDGIEQFYEVEDD